MSDSERFSEKEIAKIFELATRAQNEKNEQGASSEGLSLEELKRIGASTGIDPELIVQAVAAVRKNAHQSSVQTLLGLPHALSRSVSLPATFSDQDWEQLVVGFRKAFDGRGEIKQDGSFREWRHGFVHAYVEPTTDGYELKLEERHGQLKELVYSGGLFLFLALIFFVLAVVGSEPAFQVIAWLLTSGGLGMMVAPFFNQPRWAEKREKQFERICSQAAALHKTSDGAEEEAIEDEKQGKSEELAHLSPHKFLSLEDEEQLNDELRQFATRKKTR